MLAAARAVEWDGAGRPATRVLLVPGGRRSTFARCISDDCRTERLLLLVMRRVAAAPGHHAATGASPRG